MFIPSKAIVLAACIALSSSFVELHAQSSQAPCEACSVVRDALKAFDELKVGDTRAELEQDFEPDGGITGPKESRYKYKKCPYIKVDVEFSRKGDSDWIEYLSTDTVVHVSKPYLQYPIYD
jgi:hypothetical protein